MPFNDKSRAELGQASGGDSAGGISIGALANDPLDSEAVETFNQHAHEVKASAADGGWAISEEGMREYQKVCDAFLDRYEEMIEKAQYLGQRAKLGSSPYAYAVAEFNVTVAASDERSLLPNLQSMKDGYEQLQEALRLARSNYDENDTSMAQSLGRLMPE